MQFVLKANEETKRSVLALFWIGLDASKINPKLNSSSIKSFHLFIGQNYVFSSLSILSFCYLYACVWIFLCYFQVP